MPKLAPLCGALLLLAGCSATLGDPPPGMANACLTLPFGAGGGDFPGPVSDLLTAFQKPGARQSWEKSADVGYIYRVERPDPLTGQVAKMSLAFANAGREQSKDCGPERFDLARVVENGNELTASDIVDFAVPLVMSAMQARIAKESPTKRVSQAPPPPVDALVPPITPPPPGQSWAPPPSAAKPPSNSAAVTSPGSPDDEPSIGNCHMDSCSWSKVLSRAVRPIAGGDVHTLTLLGGSTPFHDRSATHIVWNAHPHTVEITCSLTHPSVTDGDQTDDLPLNAVGSPVPDVLMSSYTLYAAECHPDAKNLDPDALARRFGYQASIEQ